MPGYTLFAGSPAGLSNASEERASALLTGFNELEPLASQRDFACTLGGADGHSSRLREFRGPVLAIGAALGFGPYIHATLDVTSSNDESLVVREGFGHADAFASADHRTLLDEPLLEWLEAHPF